MGKLVYMQPMMLSLSSLDAAIDDSRARKMIGSALSCPKTWSLAYFYILADINLNGRLNSVSNILWMNSDLGDRENMD